MPGWEVSRHPEWEQMYAAGITVREIADIVHHPRASVDLHLQVREQYIPGLRATHNTARAGRVPGWPRHHWRMRASELKYFVVEHGQGPQEDGELAELVLYKWVEVQRKQSAGTGLHPAKITILDTAWPDWAGVRKPVPMDLKWLDSLEQLIAFIKARGHLPRWRRHTSEQERILGVWLHTQHQRRAEGRLLPWRLEKLDEVLPGWRSTM